jgi:chorismate synthase
VLVLLYNRTKEKKRKKERKCKKMAGSVLGEVFKISTWGESHGAGLGVVVDGCPAGLPLSEDDIQRMLDRRKPGETKYSTPRKEGDKVQILSGVFEGKTTGTPISMMVQNTSQKSKDYSEIANYYRPGHADYTFDAKYGFRDYRGGGRSSGRETIGRVAAGAIAEKILEQLGVQITAYTKQIGPFVCREDRVDKENIEKSPLRMPDLEMSEKAEEYLSEKMKEHDSVGGIVECVISGVPAGVGEPVFGKLDAALAGNIVSIGAVKGVEIGAGFQAAEKTGSQNNDSFYLTPEGKVRKNTNFAGGILGGISDGDDIILRAAFKPTPSIFQSQKTVNRQGEEIEVQIKGRHDPVIMPRAVVVVEAMAALTLVDKLFVGMTSRIDWIQDFYTRR